MKAIPLLSLFLVSALKPGAQESFTIAWSSLDSGGGPSSGAAEFTLAGSSLGQMSAGDPDSGPPGEFDITGGYWTFDLEPPPDLNLTMHLDGGIVTLTWETPVSHVVLESSDDLQLWTPVNPQPVTPVFQEPEGTRRFYRLVP